MKTPTLLRLAAAAASLSLALTLRSFAAEAKPDDATQAWQELRKAATLPAPPSEWRDARPPQAEIDAFMAKRGEAAEKAAVLAKEFQTKFPKDARFADAKRLEVNLTQAAVQLGRTNLASQAEALVAERLKDPSLPDDEKFAMKLQALQKKVQAEAGDDRAKLIDGMLKGAIELKKEFPKAEQANQFLLMIASNIDDTERARAIAKDVLATTTDAETKAAAADLLKASDRIGQPLALKFTSVEGKEIDLSKMKGQVVLVDFWATWCGPCMAELPNVKAAYAKLHPKGFEIVGISFDQDKGALEKALKKEGMTWPQYFDGEGWENKFGQEFGIKSIPAMWLVDKKGVLRDTNARAGLEEKVEKLLAEP